MYILADEALEDALYDSQAMREFIGIDLGRENVPDATTLLKFRRLLEQHDLTAAILAEVNAHLTERGLLMRRGTVVDATIIAAPSSTKNEDGKLDPEMHQPRRAGKVRTTVDGQAFYERCRHLLSDLEDGESSLAQLAVNPRGRLRIDIPCALSAHRARSGQRRPTGGLMPVSKTPC